MGFTQGVINLTDHAKWTAYHKLLGMSQDEAKIRYITAAKKIQDATTDSSSNNSNNNNGSKAAKKPTTNTGTSFSPSQSVTMVEEGAAKPGDPKLALHVSNGDLEKIKEALSKPDVNVNASNEDGVTVLCLACDRGDKEQIQLLLEHKADVSAEGGDDTPLHALMYSRKATVDIIDLLVEAKVRLSCWSFGGTVLLIHFRNCH